MKKHVRIIALVFCVLCTVVLTAAGAETLIQNFGPEQFKGYENFKAQYPEVDVRHATVFYSNTTELSAAVVARSVQNDLLALYTEWFDCKPIMEKGYCSDLSGYPEIVAAVNRMYPRIREQCMVGGRIYALPWSVNIRCYWINLEAWAYAGSSVEDIPDSFAGMLDWIEKWLDRAEAEDIRDVNVALCDPFGYDRTSYPYWLTDQVLRQYILQQQFAGAPLRFDEPELRELLIRCKTLGDRLYQQEEPIDEDGTVHHYRIIDSGSSLPADQRTMVFTRLYDDQPRVLDASIGMVAIPTTSAHQETAAALLCSISSFEPVTPTGFDSRVYLFQDAQIPLNPEYESKAAEYDELIAAVDRELAAGKTTDKNGQPLEERRKILEEGKANLSPYLIPPETVEAYRAMADGLYFAPPSVFWGRSEDVAAFNSLKEQYAAGSITVDELLSRLNEMARMIQAENQ